MATKQIMIAAVDGPDQQHLTAVKIFPFPPGGIPSRDKPECAVFMAKVGLARWPDRWVDITDRPDIQVGEPFPFQARKVE